MTMVIANPILRANCRKPEFWFNDGDSAPVLLTERARGLKENYVSQSQTPDL